MNNATDKKLSRLTLGTATLGMRYGVSNPKELLDERKASEILDQAWSGGISCFDTAPSYGKAEARLGAWQSRSVKQPFFCSKLPALDGDVRSHEGLVRTHASSSMKRLGVSVLDAYLTHSAKDYLRPDIRDSFERLRAEGLVRAVGVSVYQPVDVFAALDAGPPDIVQLPINAFDIRMVTSGALTACQQAGVCVFARSVFLQGALLIEPKALPQHLSAFRRPLYKLGDVAAASGDSVVGLLLRFVLGIAGINSVIIGVHSLKQLDELLEAADQSFLPRRTMDELEALAGHVPQGCLDPRSWPGP